MKVFHDVVLNNADYVSLITSDTYTHRTYYMGMVDARNRVSFYDGELRVVDPDGKEHAKFAADRYLDHVAEHVEPWSYVKFCYLKSVGWKGFVEGKDSGVYAVAPLARLNASLGMATPEAQAAHDELYSVLGPKPVHHTLANHWARVVEMVQAAETLCSLLDDPAIAGSDLRTLPKAAPKEGIGAVEAPRGTLFHHYATDENGIITKANLIVATQGNSARMAMGVEKAAKGLIRGGQVSEGLLNRIEMAFRAYDPCHGCATHSLPGQMPLVVTLRDASGRVLEEHRR